MTFDSFPKKPLVVREPDGRISVYVGSGYETMDAGPALAMHSALGEVLASSGSRILTCVYCGHQYPQATPAAGDMVLTEHIRVCEKHPMRGAEATIGKLRGALEGLVGTSDRAMLQQMEVELRRLPAPWEDKSASITAVQTLLELSAGEVRANA